MIHRYGEVIDEPSDELIAFVTEKLEDAQSWKNPLDVKLMFIASICGVDV